MALSERFAGSAGAIFDGLRAAHRSPLATVRAYAACMANSAPTPDGLLRNLAYLHDDLADDVLRGHLVENARATRRELEALIKDAIAAGELRREVDVRGLARTVEAVVGGIPDVVGDVSGRQGGATGSARDLDAVLAPWLKKCGRRSNTSRRRGIAVGAHPRRSHSSAARRRGRRTARTVPLLPPPQ